VRVDKSLFRWTNHSFQKEIVEYLLQMGARDDQFGRIAQNAQDPEIRELLRQKRAPVPVNFHQPGGSAFVVPRFCVACTQKKTVSSSPAPASLPQPRSAQALRTSSSRPASYPKLKLLGKQAIAMGHAAAHQKGDARIPP
jgi:hypothetical protein